MLIKDSSNDVNVYVLDALLVFALKKQRSHRPQKDLHFVELWISVTQKSLGHFVLTIVIFNSF